MTSHDDLSEAVLHGGDNGSNAVAIARRAQGLLCSGCYPCWLLMLVILEAVAVDNRSCCCWSHQYPSHSLSSITFLPSSYSALLLSRCPNKLYNPLATPGDPGLR